MHKGLPWGCPRRRFRSNISTGHRQQSAVVEVHGSSMIFANINSGSGARYAAGQYIWWEAGGAVTFYSDSLAGKTHSACHRVNPK